MASVKFSIDFIGIGTGKAGTTWVSECLAEHPQVCVSQPKELNFFCEKTIWIESTSNRDRGQAWFESKFRHWREGQLRGEFSPNYMIDPKSPELIHAYRKDLKLIACFRNPVERLYSMYYQLRKEYAVPDTFEKFMNSPYDPVATGFYSVQIKRFLEYFPPSAFHFLFFEDIKERPGDVMKSLYRFLEIDQSFVASKLNEKVNERKEPRSVLLRNAISGARNFLNQNAAMKKVKHVLSATGVEYLVNRTLEMNLTDGKFPPMKPETRGLLTEIYTQDIDALSRIVGRDLSSWTKT